MSYGIKIMVEGDYACFTKPEMKVERVSYSVPTPSACEGILKCIYWKPAIRWVIDKIYVFNPIRFANVRRNEVKEKVLIDKVKKQMKDKQTNIFIYSDECRSQRAAMVLRDVRYGIEAHFEMTGLKSDNPDECAEKHYSIIMQRLKNGKFFRQPVLGCREFSVKKLELVDAFPIHEISDELKGDVDLGYMLYRPRFIDGGIPVNGDWENPVFSDEIVADYYRPHMIDGCIEVQKYKRG